MPSLDHLHLTPAERARIAAVLAEDPALDAELSAIDEMLEPAARDRFWRELAAAGVQSARPAAAVLVALERAALGESG